MLESKTNSNCCFFWTTGILNFILTKYMPHLFLLSSWFYLLYYLFCTPLSISYLPLNFHQQAIYLMTILFLYYWTSKKLMWSKWCSLCFIQVLFSNIFSKEVELKYLFRLISFLPGMFLMKIRGIPDIHDVDVSVVNQLYCDHICRWM